MKKVMTHEKEPAGDEPQAIGEDQPPAGAEQDAPALVEGDGALAADASGEEHAGGAAPADGRADGPAVGEAAGEPGAGGDIPLQDLEPGAKADANGAARAAAGKRAGLPDEGLMKGARDELAENRHDQDQGSAEEHAAEAGDTDGPSPDPDSAAAAETGDPAAPEAELGPIGQFVLANPNVMPAISTATVTLIRMLEIVEPDLVDVYSFNITDKRPDLFAIDTEAYIDAARLIARIGERATIEVIGQEMLLKRHRDSAALSGPERIALSVFRHVLLELNAYQAAEAARIAAEEVAANRPAPRPIPIEDSVFEPADGPLDTIY